MPVGRPKGCKNKFTTDIREKILAALDLRGGVEYLHGLDDANFCRLLARVIPQQIEGDLKIDLAEVLKTVREKLQAAGKL